MSQLSLLEEIEKCKQEMGGPFFNKRENQRHRQEQEQIRMQEEMRGMRGGSGWGPAAKMQPCGGQQSVHECDIISPQSEKIVPRSHR
jgi:hypothetical protein